MVVGSVLEAKRKKECGERSEHQLSDAALRSDVSTWNLPWDFMSASSKPDCR